MRSSSITKAGAALLCAILLALAGCSGGRADHIPYAPSAFNQQPDSLFTESPDYRLGPSDVVTVAVFRVPELTGDYRVNEAGTIMMPLVGQIPVRGQTVTQLAGTLRETLGRSYYVNPDVSVSLKEAASQRITVDGAVNQPGVYPLPGQITLMQAVAMAQGTTQDANLRRVIVFRQIDGQRMAAGFDLREIRAARMEDPQVYASDIIVVDGSQSRQMWRDVLQTVPILALFRPLIL